MQDDLNRIDQEVERAAMRVEATIHKINGHWWNRRKRPEAPDLRTLLDALRARALEPKQSNGEG